MTRNNPFVCPCGCALQLSPRDYADHVRLLVLVGEMESRPLSLKYGARKPRKAKPDPTVEALCRSCGRGFDVLDFIGEFLKTHGMRIACEVCR